MVSRYVGRKEPTVHCFMSQCGPPPQPQHHPQHPPPPQSVGQFRLIANGRPDVGFHVAAASFAGPQPGGPNGPPGGIPNMPRGIHHPGHHGVPPGPGNPSLPPQGSSGGPGQSGGQQGGQQPQNQGPQGPTPTSTPPGDMGKQPPQHLQQQQQPTQLPPGVIYGVGVANQARPPNAQTFYRSQGGPAPRIGNHRNQMVNIQPAHVGQQMFQHQVQMQSLPQMYPSPVVPQMQQQMFVTHGQMPIYGGQPRHQHNTNAAYFTQQQHQPILMAQHPLYATGYPQQHAPTQAGPQFYYQTTAPVSMQRPGGGVPGGPGQQMAQAPTQQVVQGGPPTQQMGQPTVPIGMVPAGPPQQVPQSSVPPQGVPPPSSRNSSGVRRKFALDIVDPKTMKSINSEIYEEGGSATAGASAANSPPGSEDSSARQTPQPSQGSDSMAMDVIADFAARVAKVASEDSSTHPLTTTFSEGSSPSPSRELAAGNPSDPANSIQESTDFETSKPIVAVEETQWKSPLPKTTSSKSELTKDIETVTKLDNAENNNVKLSEVERVFPKEFVPQSANPKLEVSREPVVESKPVPVVIKKEPSLLENSNTPVVSANADTPAITLVHKNKTVDYPSLKSSNQVNQSPRKKQTPKEAPPVEVKVSTVEKSVVQTVQLVPTVALTTTQETKPLKKEEFVVPQAPSKDRPNAKKDKTVRGRPEKSSLSRDRADKNSRGSTERKTSGSRDRETINRKNSSQSREREAAEKRDKTPRPREVEKQGKKKEVETPEREIVATPPPILTPVAPIEDMKQANGEVNIDSADGKVPKQHQQNAKAVKKGKMRDRKAGADKEPAEIEVAAAVEEVVPPTPTALPEVVVPVPVTVVPVVPEPQSAPSPVPKEEEEELDVEKLEQEESDKMVLARNEENAKVTAAALKEDAPPVIENVPATETKVPPPLRKTLSYKDDQWSPQNTLGKKKYDRDFLMELKEDPQSKKKPENLPDMDVVLKDSNNRQQSRGMPDQRQMVNRNQGAEAFAPNFMRTGGSNSRGPVTKRNSQQGKPVNKSGKPNVIHMSLSLREDVKLHETENAWKPDVMRRTTGAVAVVEGDPTEELYKSVRGVLNKLTPQKFDTLVSQVQALPIDNEDKLNNVINLVFLKAVDEPGFSVAYAQMCKVLSGMQVPAERKSPTDPPHVNFRKLIVNRCQTEFEKNNEAELDKEARLKEINLEDDPEKKKELMLSYEEEERKVRMKSVGNIRFIGELFKLQMLTTGIMHRCISHLLSSGDEESLECLCKLLTTIGKDLESKGAPSNASQPSPNDLTQYFTRMKDIAGRRGSNSVSSRVRFMLQDVIELRQSKWVPRRDDANPKTMDQIQKEAERETMDMHLALQNQPPQTPRRQDDRGNMDRRGGNKNMRDSNQQNVDGWTNVPARTNRNLVVDSSKIKVIKGQTEIDNNMSLGSGSQFNKWARGAGGSAKSEEKKPSSHNNNNNNLFNVLQDTDYTNQRGKSAPSASIEKERMLSSFKTYTDSSAAHSSRSSSVQQTSRPSSRDSSSRRGGSISMGSQPSSVSASTEDISRLPSDKPKLPELSSDEVLKKATLVVGELLSSNMQQDCGLTVQETFPSSQMHLFIYESLNHVLEKSTQNRLTVGKFMSYLIENSILKKEHYLEGLKEILGTADDIAIDVPKIWLYLAETIVPLLSSELLSFTEFRDAIKIAEKASQIVVETLQLLCKDVGPNWIRERWEKSGLKWTDFMESGLVEDFIKSYSLEYTVGGVSTAQPTSSSFSLTMEDIRQKLVSFLKAEVTSSSSSSFDQVFDWIAANVGDRVKEPMFFRALMSAICDTAIYKNENTSWRLKEGVIHRHHSLLQKYVDNQEPYELQCLYAIQSLIVKLEHPQGLCCNIFQELSDNNIFSVEAFLAWENCKDPAEQVGKGVALKSLTSFYTNLKESESSCDES